MKTKTLIFYFVGFLLAGMMPALAQEVPKNVVLMIPDGFGPASLTLGRGFKGEDLALDGIVVGIVHTYSSSSRVTDSAASATAYATGHKSYNGAISVDTLKQPLATVLEAAKRKGMATGLVATGRVTHATPAAFASHVPSRSMENDIAVQILEHDIDLIMGGGRRHFLPKSKGGQRTDERDLLVEAGTKGYRVAQTRSDYDNIQSLPILGLFTESHMSYEIDRADDEEPSLAEMTEKAIQLLSENPNGFFLMIEGSRIDHAGHGNDPAAHVREILAYDEALATALRFAQEDGETLVISVADHETGGLTLGRRVGTQSHYAWRPEVLKQVKNSFEAMGKMLLAGADLWETIENQAGLPDLTEEEKARIQEAYDQRNPNAFEAALSAAISERALLGWTTNGHTGVDVILGAFGPGSELLRGSRDNTEIGQYIATFLGLDLAGMTQAMRSEN